MTVLYEDPFYTVDVDTIGVAVMRRSGTPIPEIAALEQALEQVLRVLQTHARNTPSATLLIDMRNAPPRNDETFEAVARHYRTEVHALFRRTAVLVRTQVGKLQVRRLNREQDFDRVRTGVFDDEAEARSFLLHTPA